MKEFIEKLIGRLEEVYNRNDKVKKEAYEEQDWERFGFFTHRNEGIYIAISIINQLAEEYNNGWIPFTQRELTEEEKEEMGTDFDYILDCKLPENDTEILICSVNGLVFTDTFFNDGDGCYLDSGYDFIEDAIAWMPLPQPYTEEQKELSTTWQQQTMRKFERVE